jgi:hypothetical protein
MCCISFKRKIALAVMIAAVVLACMGAAAVDVDEVRAVGTPEDARRVFRGALEGLSGAEKGEPEVVEALTLLAEECVRYAGGEAPGGTVLDMMDSAAMYGVEFVRKLRIGATVYVDGEAVVEVDGRELGEAAGEQYDYVCIEAPFARLRLDARDAAGRGDVAMRDLRVPTAPEKPAVIEAALRFWSVWAILVSLIVSLAIEPLRRKAPTRWITLATCLALAGGNALSLALTREEIFVADDGVEISIAEGAPFILSLPARDEYEAELTVVDADGKPLPCKYNSLTRTVDARVNAGGKYYLRLSAVYFTDIADKSDEMRRAVRVLTSCGLMDGADERSFLPDREITRAEFASVMLRVMGLLDESAESRFTDVLRSDWFYAAAASAEKEGMISGYEDGTFRGNTPIPKEQMVTAAANALTRMMDYSAPEDEDAALAVYSDGAEIPRWARSGAALATRAGIVPRRGDGKFGGGVMTRGDAAIILHRLFERIW